MQKFNPFRPSKAVSPGMFSGRANEISIMEKGLFQTKNDNPQHFLIEGERGIGKTSLLLYMDWIARGKIDVDGSKFNMLTLNVELREGMSSDDVIDAILVSLRHEISDREPLKEKCKEAWKFLSCFEVAGVSYHPRPNEQAPVKLDELSATMIDILKECGDEIDGIVLLIDEADRAPASANLGELCKLLTERLTRNGCERACIVLAGLPGLTAKIRESHESAPRIFTILPLEPLEPSERDWAVKRGLEEAEKVNGFKTEISPEALDLLSGFSEGYPHFLQEFAFNAFDADNDNKIEITDVMEGAFQENGALSQLGQKYYQGMYFEQISSDSYRKVLMCMAHAPEEWVERQYLIDNSGIKSTTVDNAIKALKERRIILPSPTSQGKYKLPTKSFAFWIKILSERAKAKAKPTKKR